MRCRRRVQVKLPVQGAEDASGQVIKRWLAERSGRYGARHQEQGLLSGGAAAALLAG